MSKDRPTSFVNRLAGLVTGTKTHEQPPEVADAIERALAERGTNDGTGGPSHRRIVYHRGTGNITPAGSHVDENPPVGRVNEDGSPNER